MTNCKLNCYVAKTCKYIVNVDTILARLAWNGMIWDLVLPDSQIVKLIILGQRVEMHYFLNDYNIFTVIILADKLFI